jgi:NAD(P)-dependent dehydrogenase (short-subunit alcohol dehydrogenase family)
VRDQVSRWTHRDIPDQAGRVALVTGANTGIGYETARTLAERHATVILACRDPRKGAEAADRIRASTPAAQVHAETLDLADLDSVRTFAESIALRHPRLDLLVANAGVMVPPAGKTRQGFELQLGTNHLGHFALVGRLLPNVLAAAGSRVVVVSSGVHWTGRIDFDDLDFERRGYQPWPAYAQSKLANLLFVLELGRRLQGTSSLVAAAHPGVTATDLQRHGKVVEALTRVFAMSPAQGCLPTLRAATDPSVKSGDYFGPGGVLEMIGYPRKVGRSQAARSEEDAARLWAVSEERTGVVYPRAG